jgi:hypothetical protein
MKIRNGHFTGIYRRWTELKLLDIHLENLLYSEVNQKLKD